MATCTSCGSDVTGKKFCQNCGTPVPVQAAGVPPASGQPAPTPSFCTNCGRQGAPGEHFCSNCGSPLGASTAAPATPGPAPTAQTNYAQTGPYPAQPQPYPTQYGQPAPAYGQPQ